MHCKEPAMRFCRRQNDAVLRRQASTRAGDFVCVGHCELDEKADESYRALFDCEGRRFCHGTQAEHTARIGMAKCKPPRGLQDRCPVCAANAARSAARAWYCNDARDADPNTMPEFDLLCGGFPCQAFSIAGSRRGFGDPRGTLFFELARLAEARHPPYLLFENVPGLLSHDGGRTFAAILDTLDGLGFFVGSIATGENDRSDKREAFLCLCPRTRTIRRGTGVPQSRRRVYLVGTLDARCRGKIFPFTETAGTSLVQVQSGSQGERIYSPEGTSCSLTSGAGGFGGNTGLYAVGLPIKEATHKGYKMAYPGDSIDLSYATMNTRRGRVGKGVAHTLTTDSTQGTLCFVDLNEDPEYTAVSRCVTTRQDSGIHLHKRECSGVFQQGRIRRLTPRECLRLQGWQDDRIDKILPLHSDRQLYKHAGNGVTVNVVQAIGQRLAAVDREVNAK